MGQDFYGTSASTKPFKRCPECSRRLPKHAYGCTLSIVEPLHIIGTKRAPNGLDRRNFLRSAGMTVAALGAGAVMGSAMIPVEGASNTNWSQGPSSMQIPTDFLISQSPNNSWYRRQGDTGNIGDSSEGDSPNTDPVPMINRTINLMTNAQSLSVKGNFSSSTTITFNKPIRYSHQGTHTYTGTGDGTAFTETGGGQSNSIQIYIFALIGPNSVSPYNANPNAIGLHMNFAYQPHIWIDQLFYWAEGVRFDVSTGNFCSDGTWRLAGFQWCNIGIHWTGSAPNINMQGHEIWMHQFACKTGVLIDLSTSSAGGFCIFRGVCANVGFGVGFKDYVNNNNRTDNGSCPNILEFGSSQTVASSTLGPLDTMLSNPDYYQPLNSVASNQTTIGCRFPRIELGQKQLAQSFTTATSLAITFPLQEPDTNYQVIPSFSLNVGNWWVTNKTVSGCTINWSTSSTGTLDYHLTR